MHWFDKYASLIVAMLAGMMFTTEYIVMSIGLMLLAGLWANGFLFGEEVDK